MMFIDSASVAVVDGSGPMRTVLQVLLTIANLRITLIRSAEELLRSGAHPYNCILIDLADGLKFLAKSSNMNEAMPTVLVTANPDVRMAVRAMKAGAIDYLAMPFKRDDLLNAVKESIEQDRDRRQRRDQLATFQGRLASLTNREREILKLLSAGCEAIEIASIVGVCVHTARVHRTPVMSKIGARSIADVVRLADWMGTAYSERLTLSQKRRSESTIGYAMPVIFLAEAGTVASYAFRFVLS